MRIQINKLNTCLENYDQKWNSIVKNVIKENADLKNQNKKLKKKITSFKSISTMNTLTAIDCNKMNA